MGSLRVRHDFHFQVQFSNAWSHHSDPELEMNDYWIVFFLFRYSINLCYTGFWWHVLNSSKLPWSQAQSVSALPVFPCYCCCQVTSVMSDSVSAAHRLQPIDSSPPGNPPSLGFSRQEYWIGLPCPSPGDLPNPGIEPVNYPALAGRFFIVWATREAQIRTKIYDIVFVDLSNSSYSLTQI